jgi:glycerophosphoryl diester phosphodiesterase
MNRKPLIIGHRGASAVAPENTLCAFNAAIEVGADGIEFDVQLSRDGVPVVIHDDNLRRTGLTDRRVADLLAAELNGIDVCKWFWNRNNPAVSSEHQGVPTLQQVFELYESNPGVLYLEMKCAVGHASDLTKACCEMIRQSRLKERIVVESFDLGAISEMKHLDSSIKTAALFEPTLSSFRGGIIENATRVGANEIALHHRLATTNIVRRAKEAGFNVVVWTVDDPIWSTKARSLNIDALITNDPALLIQADTIRHHRL